MENWTESNLTLLALLLYFTAVVAIGIYYSRRNDSTEDFILAGHSLSTPFVTGSVVATWLGGAVIIGGAREAYVGGFQAIVWDPWSPVITLLLCGFLFVSVFRKSRFVTAVDYYRSRYSNGIVSVSLVVSILAYISWLSAQLLSLGVLISLTTGLDTVSATIAGAVVVLTIAVSGGLWALSRSDMLAFIILSVVLLAILPYALGAVGGPMSFVENAGNADGAPPFSLFYTSAPNADGEPTGFYGYLGLLGFFYMLAAWFSVAIGDLGGSVLTARALAAKDEAAATRGFIYGGFIYLVLGMIPVIVGMCIFILNPAVPEDSLDAIFPWFVQNHAPTWLAVLFIIAASSAIISTAGDTILTSGALLGYTALRMVRRDASDRQCLVATRVAMLFMAGASLLFGLAMGNLYNLLVFAGAVAFPVMSVTAVCGILWKKANVRGAWASIAAGTASWIILVFLLLPQVDGEVWDAIYIASVPAFLASLVAMVVVSLLTQQSCPPRPITDIDGNDISDARLFNWHNDSREP